MMSSREINVSVYGIFPVAMNDGDTLLCVVLGNPETDRAFPIFIDICSAAAIEAAFELTQTPRPLTHSVCINLLSSAGAKIEKVVVNDIRDGTYFANIFLKIAGGGVKVIDSRPSDAIAFALEANSPIFVEEKVFDHYEEVTSQEAQESLRNVLKNVHNGH